MTDAGAFVLILFLSALAGWVDAAGLANASHIFLSFMSGNTTNLSVSLARQNWPKAAVLGLVVALFVLGVVVGELLEPLIGRRGPSVVLAIEALFLALSATLQIPNIAVVQADGFLPVYPAVFAMGLQNATMPRANGTNIGLTYVTGTLVQIGRAVASVIRGGRDGHKLGQYFAVWISLATGAVVGAMASSLSPFFAMAAAAGYAAVLAVVTALQRPAPA